ncbi:MAG: hypothetical protein ACFFDK_06890 [Promethearchaeota archaeon]
MSIKEKIVKQLRKGYSPIEAGPNENINKIYKNFFKPRVDKKDLDFFIELFDTNESCLRAWGFLGIQNILKDSIVYDDEKKTKIQKIVSDLLNDKCVISYYGGSTEICTPLREHHVRRLCELDTTLIFEPVYEYVKTSEGKIDDVIVDLLERVLSKVPDSRVEPLLLDHTKNINPKDFTLKSSVINAFEHLGENGPIKNKDAVLHIFRTYLKEIEIEISEVGEIEEKRKLEKLRENIFKVAAVLDLDLEIETLEFLDKLAHPYNYLPLIATKYKNNEKFISILLKKLNNTNNPNFVKDILIAILIIRGNIKNWKNLVIDNINKYQIIDGDLIVEMEKANLYNEDMLINFLREGNKWQLEFIREFLVNNPQKLDNWPKFQNEFINVLKTFKSPTEDWNKYPNLKEKKELALKVVIDLEKKDLTEYALDNFKNLEDDELRKIALFTIIKLGKDDVLIELKKYLEKDKESSEFFKKFWRSLEARDMQFYY